MLANNQIVEWAFGKRMTPAERLRKHKNSLRKTVRELEREQTKLQQQEKKLKEEIRRSAKDGHMGAAKIQAKDLVRTRKNIEKFASMKMQVQTLQLRLEVCSSCSIQGRGTVELIRLILCVIVAGLELFHGNRDERCK